MNQRSEPARGQKLTLAEICRVLDAEVISGGDKLDEEIRTACWCDLMSDVLAFTAPGSVLLTGLTNQQVVRTAEMLDLKAIIFVRNKRPDQATLRLAESKGLPILLSPYPLYESCGRLYLSGLEGCDVSEGHGPVSSYKKRPSAMKRPAAEPGDSREWGE